MFYMFIMTTTGGGKWKYLSSIHSKNNLKIETNAENCNSYGIFLLMRKSIVFVNFWTIELLHNIIHGVIQLFSKLRLYSVIFFLHPILLKVRPLC